MHRSGGEGRGNLTPRPPLHSGEGEHGDLTPRPPLHSGEGENGIYRIYEIYSSMDPHRRFRIRSTNGYRVATPFRGSCWQGVNPCQRVANWYAYVQARAVRGMECGVSMEW